MKILTKQYIQYHITSNNIDTTKPFGLNLSINELTSIKKDTFDGLDNLEWLNLCRNQITSIEKDAFDGLHNLKWLDLCRNQITSIEKDAFDGLHNLKWLDLSSNQISSIKNKDYESREEILKLINDLKNNNLSQTMGQDCDTINHSIPLEKSSKIFEEIGKIRQNRPALHGSACDNFKKIAALWSAYLNTEVTIQDVGFMMAMLKAVRHKNGDRDNVDNFVDGANYIALAGEMLYSLYIPF